MSTLLEALEAEDEERALKLIGDDPTSVKERDATGRVALHYAAEAGDTLVFRAALAADTSLVDARDEAGFTPLFVAASAGHTTAVRELLMKGARVDAVDTDGHSAAHWAAVLGECETLDTLLDGGARVDTSDAHGAFALHYAATLVDGGIAEARAAEIVESLLRAAPTLVDCRDIDGRTPLLWAASCGEREDVCVWRRAEVEIFVGNTAMVQRLIEAGADRTAVDRDRLNALHCAASHGFEPTLRLLVRQCGRRAAAARDKNGDSSLFYA